MGEVSPSGGSVWDGDRRMIKDSSSLQEDSQRSCTPGATHEAIKSLFVGTVLTSVEDFLLGMPRFRPRLNLSGIPKNRTAILHALPLSCTPAVWVDCPKNRCAALHASPLGATLTSD